MAWRTTWLLCLSLLMPACLAAPTDKSSAPTPYRFCTQNLPPYSIEQSRNGIAIDVVTRLAEQLHWPIKVEFLPWQRALSYARTGECDAIFTLIKTPEREGFLVYPDEALMPQRFAFFVPTDSPIRYDGQLAQFVGRQDLSFGITDGKSYSESFDTLRKTGQIARLESSVMTDLTFKMFLAHRFDVLV